VPTAIHCSNLKKTYRGKPPVDAVRGVDLEVEEGECFGVLGPNGAGKTTTIEILEGLLTATDGDVEILGMRWKEQGHAIRQEIGISLQETQLADKLTVLETLTLFRSFYSSGMEPREAIAQVSLEEKSKSWVKKLSGGQKQRLAVATALVGNPRLLFLDEPTTGLDPMSRRQLWEIIERLRSQGKTVLLTTHYMEEAERLCDRVAILDNGKVIALGTPHELIMRLGAEHIVEFSLEENRGVSAEMDWTDLPAVTGASIEVGRHLLSVSQPHVVIPALINRIEQRGWKLASLTTRHASLDDVFVSLTGRHVEESEKDSDD